MIGAKIVIEERYDSQGRSGFDTQTKDAFIGLINPIKNSCAKGPATIPGRMAKAASQRVDRNARGLFPSLHPATTVSHSCHYSAFAEGKDQRCILVAGSFTGGSLRMKASVPRQALEVGGGIGSLSDDQRSGSKNSHSQPDYGISQSARDLAMAELEVKNPSSFRKVADGKDKAGFAVELGGL